LYPRADGEEPSVDRRSWLERRRGQMSDEVERPPRLPAERDEVGRTRRRTLSGDVPLDEDVDRGELKLLIVEDSPQYLRRRAERQVADNTERRTGERDLERVAYHDLDVRG